ncbi:hypothetical protein NCCP2222_37360 [Sporosarcina sp. NCCP-2222]|uniref:hypothetical protein n=1 Tax=Sporosarcina sp. NCCP-2222 TaxID=2935073 RepID=UPI0020858579|nr:hypothetical protein [Sporosarcina sp. NCCP-2222]GKV57789.1 hypothetical protein NCCP2222_37360 [Sporosarcina sp. NCCP-2222]
MKRPVILLILSFTLAIGIIGYKISSSTKEKQFTNTALAIMFDSIEEMTGSSQLVITGEIFEEPAEYERQLTDKVVTEHLYQVRVSDVLHNNLTEEITIGDELTVSRALFFKTGNSTYALVDEPESLKPGTYLLFLNGSPVDRNQFTPVSPNHIYREDRNGDFLNVVKDTDLNKISPSDLSIMK